MHNVHVFLSITDLEEAPEWTEEESDTEEIEEEQEETEREEKSVRVRDEL